jgi:hypothetical protein
MVLREQTKQSFQFMRSIDLQVQERKMHLKYCKAGVVINRQYRERLTSDKTGGDT